MRDANPTAQQKTPRSSGWSGEGPLKNPRRYLLSRLLHYHRLGKLNYCVRYGNRCGLSDMVTGKSADRPVKTRRGEFVVGMDGKFPLFWPIKAQSESSLLE